MRCISPSIRHVADGDGWMQTTSHDSGHNVLVIHPKVATAIFNEMTRPIFPHIISPYFASLPYL